MKFDAEALVIGSGFGGGILACRLAKRWPKSVLLIERGRRYSFGSFPRSPHAMARNFFNQIDDGHKRPNFVPRQAATGLFDVRSYDHIDVVGAAGLGGGSLIYANVYLEPPAAVFDQRWPATCKKSDLAPYYAVSKQVLGARTLPSDAGDPRRAMTRTKYFAEAAAAMGRKSELVPLMVHFGNNWQQPLAPGLQELNRYGALQSSCTYCAECDIGCNVQAKNSIELNYLFVAEHRYGARIFTEHEAVSIVPLNAEGEPDPSASGAEGFAVEVRDLQNQELRQFRVQRVICAAGTLGSNELLLKCRDTLQTLPRISQKLGANFSGNGDFLSFIVGADRPANPNYGPVITQKIDFNLFEHHDAKRGFIMEDAAYPNILAWFIEGQKPLLFKLPALWLSFKALLGRLLSQPSLGRIGGLLSRLLGDDLSQHASVHLCMGIDRSDGQLTLDSGGALQIHWPGRKSSRPLYDAINLAMQQFRAEVKGRFMFHMPTWRWPLRRNVTVHPLGGCAISFDIENGVTSCFPETFGAVHAYQNLFVADGSLLPTAVGANPSATIAALAERVAEGITGMRPDADL